MNMEDSVQMEALEIADLEYDVGGMGAEESAESRASLEGFVVIMVGPKQGKR